MSTFFDGGTALPDGKSDARPLTGPANLNCTAAEWNLLCEILTEIRARVTSEGKEFGLIANEDATVSANGYAKIAFINGKVQVSENGGNFLSGPVVNVQDFGAEPDPTLGGNLTAIDSKDAFYAAMNSLSASNSSDGGTVFIPRGKYRISSTSYTDNGNGGVTRKIGLLVTKKIKFIGEGTSQIGTGTELWFDKDCQDGVRVEFGSGSYTYGNWSSFEGISIFGRKGVSGVAANANGLHNMAQVTVRDCSIDSWTGIGWWAEGGSTNRGLNNQATNANFCYGERVTIANCGSHGFYMNGEDGNKGCFTLLYITTVGGYGIYDGSGFGNVYVAPAIEATDLAPLRIEGAVNQSTVLGGYAETVPPAEVDNAAIVLGFSPTFGFTGIDGFRINSKRLNSFNVAASPDGDDHGSENWDYLQIGSLDDGSNAWISIATPRGLELGGATARLTLGRNAQWYASTIRGAKEWASVYPGTVGNGIGDISIAMPGTEATIPSPNLTYYQNRGMERGGEIFLAGVYLGVNSGGGGGAGRYITTARDMSAYDYRRTWHAGDFAFNATPGGNSGILGWRCTSGGTFGTYGEGLTGTATGNTFVTLKSGGVTTATTVLRVGMKILLDGVYPGFIYDINEAHTVIEMDGNIPAGSGMSIAYVAPVFEEVYGVRTGVPLVFDTTDSSGSPGAATINKPSGRSAVANGASSVTITNSLVTAATKIGISARQNDSGVAKTWVTYSSSPVGFVFHLDANATADYVFDWWIIK